MADETKPVEKPKVKKTDDNLDLVFRAYTQFFPLWHRYLKPSPMKKQIRDWMDEVRAKYPNEIEAMESKWR